MFGLSEGLLLPFKISLSKGMLEAHHHHHCEGGNYSFLENYLAIDASYNFLCTMHSSFSACHHFASVSDAEKELKHY